jgi:hypothetical protein
VQGLHLIPVTALPPTLAVGGGTALFIDGRCLETDAVTDAAAFLGDH